MLDLRHVAKFYGTGSLRHSIIEDATFQIGRGEFCALLGSSGSGKSTLLNIIGLLNRPSSGTYMVEGLNTAEMDDKSASNFRSKNIGFIFQSFHLLARLTAQENVALPLTYHGIPSRVRQKLAGDALSRVGLEGRLNFRPDQLSGGQKQRVAIARALVAKPSLLLADEPTGNLDSQNANAVMDLLLDLNRRDGLTTIMVTHDPGLAARTSRRIVMLDGHIRADTMPGLPDSRDASQNVSTSVVI